MSRRDELKISSFAVNPNGPMATSIVVWEGPEDLKYINEGMESIFGGTCPQITEVPDPGEDIHIFVITRGKITPDDAQAIWEEYEMTFLDDDLSVIDPEED
jgi:hypothetical protein